MDPFVVPAPTFTSPASAGTTYVKLTQPPQPPRVPESALLKSIRQALSATTPIPYELPRRTLSASSDGEEELFWIDRTVVWSIGGVQRRKWVFETEAKDQVLWACWASFDSDKFSRQFGSALNQASAASGSLRHLYTPTADEDFIATFGLFSGVRPPPSKGAGFHRFSGSKAQPPLTRCICIFLTSFVMMYTKDGGLEYAANLPFHVKRVWELSTGGVVIERVVAADETEGDLLPTLFSLSGPYDEVKIAGFAHSIEGGVTLSWSRSHPGQPSVPPGNPSVTIRKEPPIDEDDPRPLRSFSKTERVLFSSSESNSVCNRILVSHDPTFQTVRIWRYVFDKSDEAISAPSPELKGTPVQKNVTSTSLTDLQLEAAKIPRPSAPPPMFRPLGGRRSHEIPSTPTQDTIAASLALAKQTVQGITRPRTSDDGKPRGRPISHSRTQSQSRNELSVTLDRMALSGSGEELRDYGLGNRVVDDGRMRPEVWLSCIHEFGVAEDSPNAVVVHMFDVRLDMGKLAVLSPSQQIVSTFSILYHKNQVSCRPLQTIQAISIAPILSLRPPVYDLLIIRPNNKLAIVTYDFQELGVRLTNPASDPELDEDDSDVMHPILDSPLPGDRIPVYLKDAVKSAVTVVFKDKTETRTTLEFGPRGFVNQVFMALSYVLPADITFDIRTRYLRRWTRLGKAGSIEEEFACCSEAIMESLVQGGVGDSEGAPVPAWSQRTASLNIIPDAWSRLASTVSHPKISIDSALRHLEFPTKPDVGVPRPSSITSSSRVALPYRITRPPSWASPAVQVLHLLGESFKISIGKYRELRLLAPLLVRMGRLVGMDWSNYWAALAPEDPDSWMPSESYAFMRDPKLPHKPQDVFHYLATRLHNTYPTKSGHFVAISQVHQVYGLRPSLEYGSVRVNPINRFVLDTYMALTDFKKYQTAIERAKAAVTVMYNHGVSPDEITKLPFGISLPLKEALKLCQEYPPMDWEPSQYILIDRYDLAKMATLDWDNVAAGFGEAYRYKREAAYKDDRETIGSIVNDAKLAAEGTASDPAESSMYNREFTDVRFGIDRRLREVDRMLQSSGLTTVKILERPDLNEHDLAKEQHQFAIVIAERTLSLSVGRAMYTYGSLENVDSDSFSIPKIDLTVRMVPQGVTIVVDQSKMISQDARMWGEFHNGVAAALRVSRGAPGVDSTWIAFNRPNDLTPEHAGFILGLGLNGHLRGLYTWHTFSYLTPKHEMTTVAMLLGLAASYVGTGELIVTRMLTVHTPALLPPGSAEMNLGLWTQMSGLMGIGVLYLGKKDRRMAEACLNEIGGRDFGTRLDVTNENREAYAVTAALAFGLIMCGQGASANSPADLDMIGKLRVLAQGQPNATESKQFQPVFGLNLTSPAATIALGLMFMKTERIDIAGLFETAYTPLELSRVQPNVLLIRTLSRLLIMWKHIEPTVRWVTTQVPKKMADNDELQGYDDAIKDSYDLAYYNIVAGVCFAIALKYAGSADQAAETTLIHYYDAFSKTASQPAVTFDAQIKRSAVRDSLNLLSLCVGMVMAGTGELNALRRLRYAHGQLMPYIKYGSHMTSHMSLGLLFLGGGRYTIGTSNAAIACLVAAFYPRWPNNAGDTKGLLPVFRHLWTLAVEPRCLIARDADSGETVYIPVKIKVEEGNGYRTYQYTSPSLIPDFTKLMSITVDSPRYWPFFIDFAKSSHARFVRQIMRTQTIWVKRRSGYLGYGEDPRGNRSIFAFIGFRVGDTATMDFPSGSAEERMSVMSELDQFITSFSVDTRTIMFADWLCHAEPVNDLEAKIVSYCQQSLLECLLHDKPSSLQTLMNVFQIRYGTSSDDMVGSAIPALTLKNLKFLNTYYAHLHNRYFGGRVEKERALRPPLVRFTLLQSAVNAMDDYVKDLRQIDAQFHDLMHAYLRGEGCRRILDGHNATDKASLATKLAFYIVNEHVPGVEVLSALDKVVSERKASKKIGRAGEHLDDELRRKCIQMVVRSVLLSANATPMWEMTSRAFDDVVEARGF